MGQKRDIWTWVAGLGGVVLGIYGVFSGIEGFVTGDVVGIPAGSGTSLAERGISLEKQPVKYWISVVFWTLLGSGIVGWSLRQMLGGSNESSKSVEEIVRAEEFKTQGNGNTGQKHQTEKRDDH